MVGIQTLLFRNLILTKYAENFPVGRLQRAKTFWTKSVSCFRDKNRRVNCFCDKKCADIADISHNHTTAVVHFFRAGVLSSIENAKFWPILDHFDNFGYFVANLRVFLYFLQAWIMWQCTKNDKYHVQVRKSFSWQKSENK